MYLGVIRIGQWLHINVPVLLVVCRTVWKFGDSHLFSSFHLSTHLQMLHRGHQMFFSRKAQRYSKNLVRNCIWASVNTGVDLPYSIIHLSLKKTQYVTQGSWDYARLSLASNDSPSFPVQPSCMHVAHHMRPVLFSSHTVVHTSFTRMSCQSWIVLVI